MQLQDVVRFRSDRLFNGAVNIDWFRDVDQNRRVAAAEAFVFHGKNYHGVAQQDVGLSHGHRLRDTASFTCSVLRRCYGYEDVPFTLAIAGYGTGKSHIGLTLATLLSDPESQVAQNILNGIMVADSSAGAEISAILKEVHQPCLVVAINGIGHFDLISEITGQLMAQLKHHQLPTHPIENLRPRFSHAATLIRLSASNSDVIRDLKSACDEDEIDIILDALTQQDEIVYEKVQQIFSVLGMPIRAIGGESLKDLLDMVCREYCGADNTFSRLVILFDEFGLYTEFATMKSLIAGSGVLQDLFEGIQANSESACFVGFIQFEMSAYVQRVAPEFRNEITRYVTRYDMADKAYLSINLETLIAHLLEKQDTDFLDNMFDSTYTKEESRAMMENLNRWFPQSQNHRLWISPEQFHTVIRKGCWPLSPYALWLLYHLAAAGKQLQERSALSLIGDVFEQIGSTDVNIDDVWSLSPVDIWTAGLEQELFTAEELGQQGAMVHTYISVRERYAAHIVGDTAATLKAVVLAAKMGMKVGSREEALRAIGALTGLDVGSVDRTARILQEEYNVLEWDDAFKQFDIIGDSVPRAQFLSFVRQRVAAGFDEDVKARLFASKITEWCDLIADIECDFAEKHRITTREWRFAAKTTNMEVLETQIGFAAEQWSHAVDIGEARGTVIYCYLDRNRSMERVEADVKKLLKKSAKEKNTGVLPILVVLLHDDNGQLGQYLAELDVIGDSLTQEEIGRFGTLINVHREKNLKLVRARIDELIKQRHYITGMQNEIESQRLGSAGAEVFNSIYQSPLSFPFDGFATKSGNAADTCHELMALLFQGKLDYDVLMSKPTKVQNRLRSVLIDCWGVFSKSGKINRLATDDIARAIIKKWDDKLNSGEKRMFIGAVLREICLPPYGANIASAGLLFAIFVAARIDDLTLVIQGRQFDIRTWFQQNGFSKKNLDLGQLDIVELSRMGEVSQEWVELLDEWEQTEYYNLQIDLKRRGYELSLRIPIPANFGYRYEHLIEKSKLAEQIIKEINKKQDVEWKRIENGEKHRDLASMVRGVAEIEKLCKTMDDKFWLPDQIEKIRGPHEIMRQTIIQNFPDWLLGQAPANDSPETVGDFKHKMNILIAGNFKSLQLDTLAAEVEIHTKKMVRNAETAADARALIRDVNLWLTQNGDACRIIRIAKLRGLHDVGNDFSNKLQGMAQRIGLPEISESRSNLALFLDKIKKAEKEVTKQAGQLWNTKIQTDEDLSKNSQLVAETVVAFEGLDSDLADFLLMQRCLATYQRGYNVLRDEGLGWEEFESKFEELLLQAKASFDEEEIPWPPDDVYTTLKDNLAKNRDARSKEWITDLESQIESLASMTSAEASTLHNKTQRPPACLTKPHSVRTNKVNKKIENHLNSMAIDWLVGKFKELPEASKKKFLVIIQQVDKVLKKAIS